MKITKEQLKQIIKEELETVRSEAYRHTSPNRQIADDLIKFAEPIRVAHTNGKTEEAISLINQMLELLAAGDTSAEFSITPQMGGYIVNQTSGESDLLAILWQQTDKKKDALEGKLTIQYIPALKQLFIMV